MYLGVVLTSLRRRNKEILIRIGKVKATWQMGTLKHRKLSVFKRLFFRTLPMVMTFWAITERVLSHVQTTEMGYLHRVHSVTFSDKVRSSEIREALNIDTLLL